MNLQSTVFSVTCGAEVIDSRKYFCWWVFLRLIKIRILFTVFFIVGVAENHSAFRSVTIKCPLKSNFKVPKFELSSLSFISLFHFGMQGNLNTIWDLKIMRFWLVSNNILLHNQFLVK